MFRTHKHTYNSSNNNNSNNSKLLNTFFPQTDAQKSPVVEAISTENIFFCIDYSKVKASRIEANLLNNSQISLKEELIEKRLICQTSFAHQASLEQQFYNLPFHLTYDLITLSYSLSFILAAYYSKCKAGFLGFINSGSIENILQFYLLFSSSHS